MKEEDAMKKSTMADVAKEAGVSKSTVSQFLNKRYEYMGTETKKKIELAIEKLEYQPNYLARSLKQKRTSMIGIIVANIVHRFSTEVSRSIEDYFHDHDIHAIVCNADDDPVKEKNYIEMLRAKQVDGLIIFPTGQNAGLYKVMEKESYPVVFMDRSAGEINVPSIVTDNKSSAYEAIRHFIESGHHKIAAAFQPLTISPRIERLAGYKQALLEADIAIKDEYIINAPIQELKKHLSLMFDLPEPPTALFAGNDLVFLEVLEFLQERRIKIGKDLSLIVFDNIPFAHLADPPVTTIAQPAYEMGKKAAEILYKQINKEDVDPETVIFPSSIIWRESSK
jgi:LacI family transcriptional regulator, kdg operon repressor